GSHSTARAAFGPRACASRACNERRRSASAGETVPSVGDSALTMSAPLPEAGTAERRTKMGRYEHVIWDWNGTLLDDVALCLDIMNRMLDERGMRRIEPVRYRQIFDFPVQLYYRQLGFDFDAEPFDRLAAHYCEQYDTRIVECALQAHARPTLERLTDRGVTQAILSSQEQNALNDALRYFRIEHHFAEVVGRHDRHATATLDRARVRVAARRADSPR